MALINVSDLLTDPDFCDSFIVARAQQSVDNNGRLVEDKIYLPGYGSVQPASNRTYDMFPEAARVAGSIEVYTQFAFTPPTDNLSSDEMYWKGKTFTIVGVQDYNNFGGGHTVALCNLKDLTAPDILTLRLATVLGGSLA